MAWWWSGSSWTPRTCAPFSKAAIRRVLPHALLVVDHFHIVQLANRASPRSAAESP
ncbi:transposase [Micromonospora sp. CPCC 205543]